MNGLKDQQRLFALSQARHSFSTTSSSEIPQILVIEYLYLVKLTAKSNLTVPKSVYECRDPERYTLKIKY